MRLDLHFAFARRGRRRNVRNLKFAVGDKAKRTHEKRPEGRKWKKTAKG
jgi:hypothetical protein